MVVTVDDEPAIRASTREMNRPHRTRGQFGEEGERIEAMINRVDAEVLEIKEEARSRSSTHFDQEFHLPDLRLWVLEIVRDVLQQQREAHMVLHHLHVLTDDPQSLVGARNRQQLRKVEPRYLRKRQVLAVPRYPEATSKLADLLEVVRIWPQCGP